MKALAALVAILLLVGCVQAPRRAVQACPQGQDYLRTAQLFLGRNVGDKPTLGDAEFRQFVEAELTPRFPNGLTVVDGGARWRASDDRLVREAQKVVTIVLPPAGDATRRIAAVRAAYKMRFHQDSVLLIGQAACLSF